MKKKVFISQPMKDKTTKEILAERKKAIMVARSCIEEKVEIIDSLIEDAPKKAKPLWFLAKSLEYMSGADVAVFTKGWENYQGCRIEHACALEYGIDIIEI